MKTTTVDQNVAAAAALASLLPSATKLKATMLDASDAPDVPLTGAVVASFVGETSADLAVVLTDPEAMTVAAGPDSALVSVADVVRPALEGAAENLGTGVLGNAAVQDATALFADPDTVVFVLAGRGAPTGWFAIRIRQSGVVNGAAPKSEASVTNKLSRISNVEMALTVEIGRTRMSIRDLLSLEPGAVIELDRSAGAPADVLLNGRLIAHGEIVVIDQDYAVRITKILDVAEGLG
ncbi:MAG: flagellar motor switch protein FliN [Homoserinimonas sp.]